jgi:hypothetical protein
MTGRNPFFFCKEKEDGRRVSAGRMRIEPVYTMG